MRPARPAVQLVDRQAYRGGWPLGFTMATCPAEAPVGCKANPAYNLNCCPSGQFCFGTLQPYCCPTDNDCGPAVRNVPVCANSTWNMFHIEQFGNRDFFCCPNGYIGVLPSSGAAGICELSGANLPTSRLATMASQIGGTSVTPFGGIPTATLSGVASHSTNSTGGASATSTTTGGGAPTGSGTPGDAAGATSSSTLPIGSIVGIAIGAFAMLVLAIALVLWLHRRSLRNRPPRATVNQPASEPTMQKHNEAPGEMQVQQMDSLQGSAPASGYWPVHSMSEAPAISRVEMEATGGQRLY